MKLPPKGWKPVLCFENEPIMACVPFLVVGDAGRGAAAAATTRLSKRVAARPTSHCSSFPQAPLAGTGVGQHQKLSLWKPGRSPNVALARRALCTGAAPGLRSEALNFGCSSMSDSYSGSPGSISVDSLLVGFGEVHPEGGGVLGWRVQVLLE